MPGILRRAAERRATPPWADLREVRRIIRTTPPGMHADHIVPLQHPHVCGLHVPANLQHTPRLENLRKGNGWWPDMWGEQGALFAADQ
ncbi:MAG: hypothetical protein EOO54_03770 [Haliea sp.]|nr:MAG: hypothetical protein EOO54_03770 [Haliea sp.]